MAWNIRTVQIIMMSVLREKEKKVHAQHLQYFSTGCEHLR